MTHKEAKKHQLAIQWFASEYNTSGYIWVLQTNNKLGWTMLDSAAFSLDTIYVINDEFSDLRKAIAEGKSVSIQSGKWNTSGKPRWVDLENVHHNSQSDIWDFEWKVIATLEVGDWVYDNVDGGIIEVTKIMLDHPVDDFRTRFSLWEPNEGDWVVEKSYKTTECLVIKYDPLVEYFQIVPLAFFRQT